MSKTEAELQARIANALASAMDVKDFDEFSAMWEDAGNSPLAGQDTAAEL